MLLFAPRMAANPHSANSFLKDTIAATGVERRHELVEHVSTPPSDHLFAN